MANARNLHLGPNATYIPLTRFGGFVLGVTQRKRYQHVGIFALGDAKVPNANGFASQWNIGFKISLELHSFTGGVGDGGIGKQFHTKEYP